MKPPSSMRRLIGRRPGIAAAPRVRGTGWWWRLGGNPPWPRPLGVPPPCAPAVSAFRVVVWKMLLPARTGVTRKIRPLFRSIQGGRAAAATQADGGAEVGPLAGRWPTLEETEFCTK